MLLKKMVVYKIENLLDGKIYIGKTARTLAERLKEHLKNSGTSYIARAIQKYGIEEFDISIVAECETEEQLNELEKFYINHFNCKVPNGYNLTDGGEGTAGFIVPEKTRKKLSDLKKGFPGHPHTENSRKKIGAVHRGKITSTKTKAKISDSKSCPVFCVELNEIFKSVTAAANFACVSIAAVSAALHHKRPTAGGYHWQYADQKEEK